MTEKIQHELSQAEADLLAGLTGDATATSGARMRGIPGIRAAGAVGGRAGALFTRPRSAVATVEVQCNPESTRQRAQKAFAELGKGIEDPNRAHDGSVWGVVNSGLLNMMPALVRVDVTSGSVGCVVRVVATGREGLISQRIGAKAADRVAAAICAT